MRVSLQWEIGSPQPQSMATKTQQTTLSTLCFPYRDMDFFSKMLKDEMAACPHLGRKCITGKFLQIRILSLCNHGEEKYSALTQGPWHLCLGPSCMRNLPYGLGQLISPHSVFIPSSGKWRFYLQPAPSVPRLMREADVARQGCKGVMSDSGEGVRHSSALRGGSNICAIAKPGPQSRSTCDGSNKPFAMHHLESFIVTAKWSW